MSRTMRRLAVLASAWAAVGGAGCLASGPLHPEAVRLNRLGAERLQAGDVRRAEAALEVSLEYHPCHADALHNLALAAYARGDLARAGALARDALACRPDLVQAVNLLGAVARRQGLLAEAGALFEEALALDPGSPEPRRNLVLLWLARGRPERAEAELLRLEALAPDDPWLPELRAELARGAPPGAGQGS